jgi:hypothetical protein
MLPLMEVPILGVMLLVAAPARKILAGLLSITPVLFWAFSLRALNNKMGRQKNKNREKCRLVKKKFNMSVI